MASDEPRLGRLRPGQRRALDVLLARYLAGERYTAIVLPTRYGKSDLMRVAAHELRRRGMPCALALSPGVLLRDQLGDKKRWRTAVERYGLRDPLPFRTLDQIDLEMHTNGEVFLSATMQLAHAYREDIKVWVEHLRYRSGRAPVCFIDECHLGGENLPWGDDAVGWADAGAHVVLLTATAVRSDARRIAGFEFDTLSEEPVRFARRDGRTLRVDLMAGMKTRLRLRAHHETTFADAWAEVPSPLCHVDRQELEVTGVLGGEQVDLADLSAEQAARALGRIVRHTKMIRAGVRRMVEQLRQYRRKYPTIAGIVFCGNDTDRDDPGVNRHAEKIRRVFQEYAPELRVVIATSASGDGRAILRAYEGGAYDVVILKQMAGLGWDAERAKIALDLSPVRTEAAWIQRLMRIATPFNGLRICVWITPDDPRSSALHKRVVTDGGGDAAITALEVVDSYQAAPGEDRARLDPFEVETVVDGDMYDTERHYAEKAWYGPVTSIREFVPEIASALTYAKTVALLQSSGFQVDAAAAAVVTDVGEDIEALRDDCNGLAADISWARIGAHGLDRTAYPDVIRAVWNEAKNRVGIPLGTELGKIKNIDILTGLRDALRAAFEDFGPWVRDEA